MPVTIISLHAKNTLNSYLLPIMRFVTLLAIAGLALTTGTQAFSGAFEDLMMVSSFFKARAEVLILFFCLSFMPQLVWQKHFLPYSADFFD